MWRRLTGLAGGAWRRRVLWTLGTLALLAVLWTLAIGWWLPRFLQPRIEAAASEALGAPLVMERIDIAPWRLEARVHGLRLGPPDAAWLRLAELRANISTESLWRRAPVIERLSLREPALALERLGPGRFNVTPMLQALAKRPPAAPDEEPARFAVHNIRVEGGSGRFVDRVAGSEHKVEGLQLGIPFVSNLPSQVRLDVEPLLDAQVNGSRLHVQGKTKPFAPGRPASIDIAWQDLDVPAWLEALAPLLPQALPLTVRQGRLDLALHVVFEQREAPAPPTLQVAGDVTLRDLQAALVEQGIAVAVPRLELQSLDLQPLERRAALKALRLQGPQVDVALDTLLARQEPAPHAGRDLLVLDAGAVAPAGSAASQPASAATPPAPWQWRLDTLELAEGRVGLAHPAWSEPRALAAIGLKVSGLDSRADAPQATLTLALNDGQDGRVQLDGSVNAASASGKLEATLADLQLAPWLAPWQAQVPVRLRGGRLDAQTQVSFAGAAWAVEQGELRLADLQVEPAAAAATAAATPARRTAPRRAAPAAVVSAADRLGLAELGLSGLQAHGGEAGKPLHVQAESLILQGLDLRAVRDERGGLAWVPPTSETPATAPSAARGESKSTAATWQLGELRCSACSVGFVDRAVRPAANIGLQRSELTLRKLSSDLAQPLEFALGTQVQGGGRVQIGGTLRPQPLALQTRLKLEAVDLRMLQPYLEPRVNLSLVSAKAHAAGELRAEGSAREALASLRWRGRLGLSELRALDQLNQAEFLRLKTLSLDGADIDWRPARLAADFGQVALEDFFARVIINADGRINLRDIVKREGEAEPRSLTTAAIGEPGAEAASAAAPASAPAPAVAASAAPSAASTPAAAAAGDAPRLRWRGIRLARGAVDFTDNFIRPNYSARLTDIDGEVSALAWDDPKPADVRIAGKVDGSAPLEIAGTVHPLGPRLATDIAASARGVDITRLSAYSARYAGYGIEKGTLSLKVHYTVKDGQLRGENQLYLDQLTFGDKVDSPNALKLPLQLAVSLLKDRNGVIDLNLPISGSLDDPQFSLGGVIVRVVVNLITKAITAPFSLLASAFGGGTQELGHVEFAPGSSELGEPARAKLDTLVKALQDRPALKLEATGHADTAADEAALRQRHVERLMRAAKARSRGELAESVTIEPAERERWLEAAYKDSDLKTKPRNLVGFAKSLPPAEMELLLQQAAPVGSAALTELANRRGDRVKAYLVEKVSPERVLLSASKLEAGGKEPAEGRRVVFALK